MSALIMLARSTIRGRAAALGGLALLVALGLGTGVASLTAAWRTEDAYPRYLREAEVSELVVNPSLLTDRVAGMIATAPGVLSVTTDTYFVASPDDGEPRRGRDIQIETVQIRSSADGRYTTSDRPIVHDGRMIGSGAEAFLNLEAAAALGVRVGDELPLAFWPAINTIAPSGEVWESVGRTTVRVVGVGVFADEVLADELYSRQRILVTPEVAAPYDCTPEHPPTEDSLGLEQLETMLFPPHCAYGYRYFSLRVAGGNAGVAAVMGSLVSQINAENERLPETLQEAGGYFYLVPAVTATERDRLERSLEPSVTALRLLGLAATGATLALAILTGARLARRSQRVAAVWHHLGATRLQRAGAIAIPLLAALAAGVAGAVVIGWLASDVGPVASARVLDPSPDRVLVVPVVFPVIAGSVLVLGLGVAAASIAASRTRRQPGRARTSPTAGAAARTGNVPFALGVRSAVRGAGATALLGAALAAVVAVLGSVVFSTNLSAVVGSPARFGWPYDAAVMVGSGYGGANEPVIAKALDRPDVESWGIAALGSATIDGEAVPFVAGRVGFDELPLQVVDGALPAGADQVATGTRTARQLGLAIGDSVTITVANYGERTGTVSGFVVLPPVGPILADRAGLGTGVLLPERFFAEVVAVAEEATGFAAGELLEEQGAFVALNLRDGVDPAGFLAEIDDPAWDVTELRPLPHSEPVRPAQIADVAAMRSAPILLAVLVTLAMAIGLALAVGLAVRARRRELAIVRALGGTGRQLRATLRWQALTIVGTGLAFGVPLGLALGRTTWRAFARGLGIVPAPMISVLWTAVIIGATLAIGVLASAVPGRIAARISPSAVLRSE